MPLLATLSHHPLYFPSTFFNSHESNNTSYNLKKQASFQSYSNLLLESQKDSSSSNLLKNERNKFKSLKFVKKTSKQISLIFGAMESNKSTPIVKDLVLLGGGHSHVIVLKQFGMKPMPGVRVTLVTRDVHTPYSGMLPGYVAGHYTYDDCHIDLCPLAGFAGARLIHCSASGIDLEAKRVLLEGRPPIHYDVLSIDIGITPVQNLEGVKEFSVPVKPIDTFTFRWEHMRERVLASCQPMKIAVVGGGAGGVELLLSMQHRIKNDLEKRGQEKDKIKFCLFSKRQILPTHDPKTAKIFSRILKERGVEVIEGAVKEMKKNYIFLENGSEHFFDECVWCTQGGAATWLQSTGLDLDSSGFILVDENLRSTKDKNVFASGDIHGSSLHPREKAGVFAVRQGLPLAKNLRLSILGKPLKPFVPQKKWLSLISTGDQYAIASRGSLVLEGPFLWKIKNYIDCSFMKKFSDLPEMAPPVEKANPVARAAGPEILSALTAVPMRCGGCGAKVGASVLSRVLSRLDIPTRPEVIVGLDSPDDAAVVRLPPGTVGVHTVDFFRSFIDDPFIFGQISANHALSDCYAMGGEAVVAMAVATLPYGLEAQTEEELFQLMSGASKVLRHSNCGLVGGHTSQGLELSLGFSITGAVKEDNLLRKGGMEEGDVLILTKAIGTGTLLAANMRGRAKGRWIDAAIESMLQSNQEASKIVQKFGATALTDVTGFGLLGHLVEMAKASKREVEIDLQSIPLLDGFLECIGGKVFSSLYPDNLRLKRTIISVDEVSPLDRFPSLFDPQTSGGLLFSVHADSANPCLEELKKIGYRYATKIGKVGHVSESSEFVRIL